MIWCCCPTLKMDHRNSYTTIITPLRLDPDGQPEEFQKRPQYDGKRPQFMLGPTPIEHTNTYPGSMWRGDGDWDAFQATHLKTGETHFSLKSAGNPKNLKTSQTAAWYVRGVCSNPAVPCSYGQRDSQWTGQTNRPAALWFLIWNLLLERRHIYLYTDILLWYMYVFRSLSSCLLNRSIPLRVTGRVHKVFIGVAVYVLWQSVSFFCSEPSSLWATKVS